MDTPNSQPIGQANGLKPNVAGALAYVLGFVSGIIIYLISKDKFARFHALQSIMLSVIFSILSYVSALASLAGFILFIFLIIKAYQGQKIKLPFIGDIAEKNA
ncbi:MAG: hypothetical protein Q7S66_03655 [bacterium]|nr:hypothetical protein [bacterium]